MSAENAEPDDEVSGIRPLRELLDRATILELAQVAYDSPEETKAIVRQLVSDDCPDEFVKGMLAGLIFAFSVSISFRSRRVRLDRMTFVLTELADILCRRGL